MQNRIIKFRAWDKERKKMSDNYSVFGIGEHLTDYDNLEIMQFTGILDKNGKEIYEGDIIKEEILNDDGITRKPHITNIIYEKARFATISRYCKDKGKSGILNDLIWPENPDLIKTKTGDFQDTQIEVIGNIYENKDLLNQ